MFATDFCCSLLAKERNLQETELGQQVFHVGKQHDMVIL